MNEFELQVERCKYKDYILFISVCNICIASSCAQSLQVLWQRCLGARPGDITAFNSETVLFFSEAKQEFIPTRGPLLPNAPDQFRFNNWVLLTVWLQIYSFLTSVNITNELCAITDPQIWPVNKYLSVLAGSRELFDCHVFQFKLN